MRRSLHTASDDPLLLPILGIEPGPSEFKLSPTPAPSDALVSKSEESRSGIGMTLKQPGTDVLPPQSRRRLRCFR